MHRAFTTVKLLPGIHPVGKSAHGPKDTCMRVVTAALSGEAEDGTKTPLHRGLAHYVRAEPHKTMLL